MSNMMPMEQVEGKYADQGVLVRALMDNLKADFPIDTPQQREQFEKVRVIFKMILEAAAAAAGEGIKMFVRGLAEQKAAQAMTMTQGLVQDLERIRDMAMGAQQFLKDGAEQQPGILTTSEEGLRKQTGKDLHRD